MGTEKKLEIEVVRKQLAQEIRQRLAKPAIETIDARDGMRDCFVSSYLGGVTEGLERFDIQGGPAAVSRVIESMFRKRLKAAGASWEAPTVAALQQIKDEIDREVHLDGLPAELKGVHDQVCTLLIGKARGDIAHHGNRSAVKAEAQQRQPAVAAGAPPAAVQPPTVVAPPVAPEVVPPSPVMVAMRLAVTAQLQRMADLSKNAASVDDLTKEIGQLVRLLDTEREVATNL